MTRPGPTCEPPTASTEDRTRLIAELAQLCREHNLLLGAAESITAVGIATALASGEDASQWFAGSVVAYTHRAKQGILGVPPGPVVTADCARHMAVGVQRIFGADIAVASTGVGGPEPAEGEPTGTVYLAVCGGGHEQVRRLALAGDPAEVVRQATHAAIEALVDAVHRLVPPSASREVERG